MKKITLNLKRKSSNVKYIINILKSTNQGKKYITLRVFSMLWDSLIPIVIMIVPGLIINELSSERNIASLAVYISLLCIYPIINHIKDLTLGLYLDKLEKQITRDCEINLLSYIADMNYSSLESPEITVQTNRILNHAPNAPIDVFNLIINFWKSVIGATSILTIISYLDPYIIIFLILFVIVNYFVNKKKSSLIYRHGLDRSKLNIHFWSEFDNLSNPSNGKEIRAYGLKDFFVRRYYNIGSELDKLECRKIKKYI